MLKVKPKNAIEIEKMRAAGKLAAQVLDFITPHVTKGISTLELDTLCHNFIIERDAIPAPLNYRGFPKSICTSINDVVCHGIPSHEDILKDGDIINIDVTVILDGYHGDTSRMFYVGDVSEEDQKLVHTTYEAMMKGIEVVESGTWLNEIGTEIEEFVSPEGYGIVRDYCGHGIGKKFHEEPAVVHYKLDDGRYNLRLRKGMTFTVEPMLNQGTHTTELMDDKWTVKTTDRKKSAQFEHTILVTESGVEILTASLAGHTCPPYNK